MDALSDVLRFVRLTGGVFLDARFTAPWGVTSELQPGDLTPMLANGGELIPFHYVVSGRLMIKIDGAPPCELKAGELLLFPGNPPHVLASGMDVPARRAAEVLGPLRSPSGQVRYGGDGEEVHIVCGYVGIDGANPLISALPPMLTLTTADTPGGQWMGQSFTFAAEQIANNDAGATTIISKLSELMFIEAVRRYIERLPPQETGWLAGLRDPAVGRALALMHTKPAHDWSADDLAREVNLSRSAFADRFTNLIGQPPMRYLTQWRMQVATHKLRDGRQTIAQIAYDVGYESEAAFTRAFRREMGAPPAAWRKQARGEA